MIFFQDKWIAHLNFPKSTSFLGLPDHWLAFVLSFVDSGDESAWNLTFIDG